MRARVDLLKRLIDLRGACGARGAGARLADAALARGRARACRARWRAAKRRWAQLAPMRANAPASSTASSRCRAPRRRCINTARRGGRAGRPHRLARAAHDVRPERGVASRKTEPPPTLLRPLPCQRPHRACAAQRSQPARPGPGRARAVGAGAARSLRRAAVRRLGRASSRFDYHPDPLACARAASAGLRARHRWEAPCSESRRTPWSLRLRSVELFERPVTLRLPFRFGAATVTRCPQAFVRVEAEVGGRTVDGATAELMVPKWFDKSPALTHEQNFEQLRESLRLAREAYLGAERSADAVAVVAARAAKPRSRGRGARAAAAGGAVRRRAARQGGGRCGVARRRAAVDRRRAAPACSVIRSHAAARRCRRRRSVALRHTVGLADRLDRRRPGQRSERWPARDAG